MSSPLLEPVGLGPRTSRNRVLFGPHVTNLGDARAISARHAAYYGRRAQGGCGVVVTEIASVHPSDWPYERAPLAAQCEDGWASVVEACRPHGALVLAGLGHAGMQGSTAWSQDVQWAPSLVASVATREQPLVMGPAELTALVEGFADASAAARRAGCDGIELNAGQHSLVRQFCSGLTNLRTDRFGEDRLALLRDVLVATRAALGAEHVLGLRFCADELAPWAGITPDSAVPMLVDVAALADYVCVVRGSIYTEAATQPDGHEAQGFNADLAVAVRAGLHDAGVVARVVAQGSVVDVDHAARLLERGVDLVEMTRAQIADPDLCAKLASDPHRVRPCLLCNQHCLVRDPRNPIVSCCVNPVAGHELDDATLDVDRDARPTTGAGTATVVGGGIAGLEAARLLARRGHAVTVLERRGEVGGAVLTAARLPGRERLALLVGWLRAEAAAEGVTIVTDAGTALVTGDVLVVATGSTPTSMALRDGDDGSVERVDVAEVADGRLVEGPVVVLDTVGGPIGVGAVELLAVRGVAVTLVTPDVVPGSQLSASGDLVAACARLAVAGVAVVCHAVAVGIRGGSVVLEDRFTGETCELVARTVVEAGHRVAEPAPWPEGARVVGDAVAPRGILMAMLEARRAALDLDGSHR